MTTSNYLITWPALLPESRLIVYTIKSRRNKPGLIKQLDAPAPPDENTIRKLNELAAKPPFCLLYKVKKHELL